jgi:hypothetical protein
LSRELEFLILCVRECMVAPGRQAGGANLRLTALGRSGLNWERLLPLARGHRCSVILHAVLAQLGPAAVPGVPWNRLTSEVLGETARGAFMLQRLEDILGLLGSHCIPVMLLKGPALGALAYPDASLRTYDDLDLLVHPADFLRAQDVLTAAGFVPLVALSETEARAQMRLGWDRGFRSPAGDYCVELCVGVGPAYFGFDLPASELWVNPRTVQIENGKIVTPDPGKLLLLLCVHGTKHLWSRLIWIADIAGLVEREGGGVDWSALERRADRLGGARMVALGLTLARDYAGLASTFPEPLLRRGDPAVQALAVQVAGRLECPQWQEPSPRVEIRFHIAARERWRDRIRYLLRLALSPGHGDWRFVPLPGSLQGLHYLIRPIRLGLKILRQLVRPCRIYKILQRSL